VYGTGLTIHIVPLGHGFARVVVQEVRQANVEVPVPTSDVRFVGQALGTFIVWPTHLLEAIYKKTSSILSLFILMLFKFTLNVI